MKNRFLVLFLSLLLMLYLPAAFALDDLDEKEKQSITALLSELRTSYAKVNDYTAIMRLENFEGEYRLQKQKMWFKKPGYLLLEQLGPFKKGAMLAILPNGVIKGHLGGFLSFVVVSIDKNDENMYGVTQDSALDSDYDRIIDIALGLRARVTDFSIQTITLGNKRRLVLDTSYDGRINRMRLFIDPKTMLIVGLERYSKGKLIHKIAWNNIQTNLNISLSKFEL